MMRNFFDQSDKETPLTGTDGMVRGISFAQISSSNLLQHEFPCGDSPILVRNVQHIHALRQAFQVDFVGVSDGFKQLAYGVVNPDFSGGCASDVNNAVCWVRQYGDTVVFMFFYDTRYSGRGANRIRLFLTVNCCDAIFHINAFCELGVGEMGYHSVWDFLDNLTIAIYTIASKSSALRTIFIRIDEGCSDT